MYNDIEIANKYLNLLNNAKLRQKDFNLSLTSVKNLLKAKRCFYTGLPLTKKTFSIDRIDSNLGYIKGNVCACDVRVNQLKADLDKKVILKLAKKLNKR